MRPAAKAAVAKPAPDLDDAAEDRQRGGVQSLGRAFGILEEVVRNRDSIVALARATGPGAFQFTDRVGVVRPAYCTALGEVLLAALRPEQFERYLERMELRPFTPKTIADSPSAEFGAAGGKARRPTG